MTITTRRALMGATTGLIAWSRFATAAESDIIGAGSSFPNAVYQKWIEMARAQAGVEVKYDPVGSGGGQNKILAGESNFGVSEMPMPDEMKEVGNLVQFPAVIGGVVCVANVPGLASNQLKLDGVLLADIYVGKIKMWNDPRIAAANPGVKLPDMEVRPVYQRDLIGTTFVFTQYILAANADWREKHGARITKRWAVGSNVDGNIFMGDTIKTVPGSIGYMDFNTALTNKYPTVQLLNQAGKYVPPTVPNFAAAAANADWAKAKDLVVSLINQPGANSWPITTPSYVQIPRKPKVPAHNQVALKFFDLAFSKGGDAAAQSNLVALPPAAQAAVRAGWAKI